jgi:DNA-binding transcriptional LysR family regulator
MLERACEVAGFVPRLDFASTDYTVIFALVQAGLGVSIVPRLALESMSADIELREIAGMDLTRTISVAIRTGSGRDPRIAAVVGTLRSVTTELTFV